MKELIKLWALAQVNNIDLIESQYMLTSHHY